MKRIIFISILSFLASQVKGQNCMTLFSYGASFETVQFFNQSEMSNAHYWWNFGDGTGSYYENPVHTYPENGRYLVTLFAKDTISNCSDYHELWLNVTKYSTDTCQPQMTDSVFIRNDGTSSFWLYDLSQNCEAYSARMDGGSGYNIPLGNVIISSEGWSKARLLARIKHTTNDTINGYVIHREVYKSVMVNDYSSALNYHDCSANFEFSILNEDSTGQRLFFQPMNSNAASYEWHVKGVGINAHFTTDTLSFLFEYFPDPPYYDLYTVRLKTQDIDGCRDTTVQQILIRQGVSTTVGLVEHSSSIPKVQVYPNPFSVNTTLKFDNPKFKRHKLTVLNTTGQIVKTISNIVSGQVTIDRENLASGIYFYKLQTDNGQTATGKLIVN